MASTTLYPPIVDSIAPAFVASGDSGYCRLYYSLSKYSSSTSQIKSIHISVIKQSSGQNVVKKSDSVDRYRSAGIIIVNTSPVAVPGKTNLYYIDILNDDIQSGDTLGWYAGWIYKIQIRLSMAAYPGAGTIGQAAWLNLNAGNFSEWSTYCTTKAINKPRITIPILNHFDSDVDIGNSNRDKEYNLSISTLDLNGTYSNTDESETLYSYRAQLYYNDELTEDSDLIYSNEYYTPNQIHYPFKTELRNNHEYVLKITYTTVNKYEETFTFKLYISTLVTEQTHVDLITVDNIDTVEDNEFVEEFNNLTSLEFEQEEGLIGIKFYSTAAEAYNGNLCIRRADSKTNFEVWEDLKIVVCINTKINDLPIFFDKTAESGVWYKYGVQIIDVNGDRTLLNTIRNPIIREWEYSYLLGEDGKQLKLKYNNTMNSYTYNYSESKTDTIGGQYPYITRNGNTKYRTIPINGLISFNMDEAELFASDYDIYKYADIVAAYRLRRKNEYIFDYDYRRELDFREAVLAFLQDGKPKLLKSPTEGNIIIRLMQVAGQPNQSLNRMIYSFTSTAHEIAEATVDNYIKYNFMSVGDYATSFVVGSTHIGQLIIDCSFGDNIIEQIWKKYNFSDKNLAGLKRTLIKVHHLSIQFNGVPMKVLNNASELVMGNNFTYNGARITVRADGSRIYLFDENINFTRNDNVVILGGAETVYDNNGNIVTTVPIEVNFLYEMVQEPYVDRYIKNKITEKGIGQIYSSYTPNSDIYRDVYYKYYYSWSDQYRSLTEIDWTCIETNPGAIFLIKDAHDENAPESSMYHEVNQTGVLNFEGLGAIIDIKYIGMRQPDGSIDTNTNVDVIVDYLYYTTVYIYEEEA